MGSNPAGPSRPPGPPPPRPPHQPPPPPSAPSQRNPGAPRDDRGEHCGPVAIERRVKEDGRALLLYTSEAEST